MPRPTLRTSDDVALAGRRWLTEEPGPTAVVLVHGFSASTDDPQVQTTAAAIHHLGLDVVSYDARGHGGSGGRSTLGDLERHDVAAAVDLARERADHVLLVGASMGAIAALRHAADDHDLAGVVSVSCPARWQLPRSPQGVLAAGMTRTPFGRAIVARLAGVRIHHKWTNPEPPADLVARLRVPVAFVHGDSDRFISSEAAYELFAAAPEPRRLRIVAGMGHAFVDRAMPEIVESVRWVLDQGPAAWRPDAAAATMVSPTP